MAPAGSFESMKAAVAAGADAVYMGGSRFGARAYAENPDEENFLAAIDYVHLHGRKIYMTVNTLMKEPEMGELYQYLAPYYERGLDAVIVQDLGVLAFVKREFPGMAVHASTQMTITGVYGAKALAELGAERVVTARELSLEEIRRIHSAVPVEIESFVHGALCYCYSGQCLMSSLIGGRSGNRGRCAQPCRLPYEVKRGAKTLNSKKESYVLNLKDLCTLDLIPDILEAGVYSMKIEGRMKSPRYTAGVVSIYRKYLDQYLEKGRTGWKVDPEDKKILLDLFDRGGFSEGYYRQHNGRHMVALGEKPAFRQTNQKLFDQLDETYVFKEIQEPIKGLLLLEEGQPSCLSLSWEGEETPISVTVFGAPPQKADRQPLTEEKAEKQMKKTGGTPFVFQDLEIQINGELFLPIQALNELRRKGLEALKEAILAPAARKSEKRTEAEGERGSHGKTDPPEKGEAGQAPGRIRAAVSVEEPEQLKGILEHEKLSFFTGGSGEDSQLVLEEIAVDGGGFEGACWKETAEAVHKKGLSCFLILPHIFREEAIRYYNDNLDQLKSAGFDGVVVRSLEERVWLREKGVDVPMIFDDTMYSWNRLAREEMKKLGAARITMPLELNSRELWEVYRGDTDGELSVYGFLPMMVSAQCVKKTADGCDRKPEILRLKDRTGKLLPVKNRCVFCYSTIYNSSPLSLLNEKKAVMQLGNGRVRLKFTVEDRKQVQAVLAAFFEKWANRGEGDNSSIIRDYTRGHFRRGVE